MSHRLFSFRLPMMMIVLFFDIFTLYFVKIAIYSSSHSCPIDMSDPVFKFSKRNAYWVLLDSAGDKGILESECGVMVLSFTTVTSGPSFFSPLCKSVVCCLVDNDVIQPCPLRRRNNLKWECIVGVELQ